MQYTCNTEQYEYNTIPSQDHANSIQIQYKFDTNSIHNYNTNTIKIQYKYNTHTMQYRYTYITILIQ